MFPTIDFNDEELSPPKDITLGKVFLFDYKARKNVLKDGKPVEANYEQAISQWITKILITEQGKYEVYKDLEFGLSINQFIGRKDIPVSVMTSEIKRQMEEQLTRHPEVESISNFNLSRQDNKAIICFNVQTKQGLIEGIEREVRYSG
ncbi:DUF2634 domain-containing protein [Marinicrinis sediminis]|uniref:DUF2634 domain-containing protein n=1 Tax=Marinicrinis sediminis TaxID=1652465 RepID=A0ABW5R9S3_9BACL